MQAFFKVGEISYHKKEKMVYFYVTKIQDLYTPPPQASGGG
jgi:hypothetical protein